MTQDASFTDGARPISAATRTTPVRTLLSSAIAFGLAYSGAGIAFTAFAVTGALRRAGSMADLPGNFLMAGYLVIFGAALNTLAFVLPVACSGTWRRLSPSGAASRSAVFGVAALAISMSGVQFRVLQIVPVLKQVPVVGVWMMVLLPGAVAGVLAVAAVWIATRGKGRGSDRADGQTAADSPGTGTPR